MEKSSTSKVQKFVIWLIIIAMTVGSLGAYFVVIIANNNQKVEQEQQAKMQAELQKQQEEEAKKVKEPLDGYAAESFDKANVTKLVKEDLKMGDGKVATKDSTVKVNYFGWTSDGTIFDSSKKDGTLSPVEFPLKGVIAGWTEGLDGIKAGGVRKLTIPADKAYGDTPQNGAPAGPLVFIVEVLEVK